MPDEEKEVEEEAEEQSIFDPPALKEPEGEMTNDTRIAQTYSSHATPSPEGDELVPSRLPANHPCVPVLMSLGDRPPHLAMAHA